MRDRFGRKWRRELKKDKAPVASGPTEVITVLPPELGSVITAALIAAEKQRPRQWKVIEICGLMAATAAAVIGVFQVFAMREQLVAPDRNKAIEAALEVSIAYCETIHSDTSIFLDDEPDTADAIKIELINAYPQARDDWGHLLFWLPRDRWGAVAAAQMHLLLILGKVATFSEEKPHQKIALLNLAEDCKRSISLDTAAAVGNADLAQYFTDSSALVEKLRAMPLPIPALPLSGKQ